MFDLIIYPLHLVSGREQQDLPGFYVSGAPRKAARMRAQDQLILSVSLRSAGAMTGADNGVYSPSQQQEMLANLAEAYYGFSGSVTAGMRSVAERLNDFLLSRNLKASSAGQTVAVMNMVVVRGSGLYIAHSGPTHSFVLSKGQVQHFDDQGGSAGRGLGLSRQAIPRLYQSEFEAGDLLMLCPDPPPTWTARTLAASPRLNFEQLRRRLLSDPPIDLYAAVIRLQAGKGKVSYWRPGEASSIREELSHSPAPTMPMPAAQAEREVPEVPAVQTYEPGVEPSAVPVEVDNTAPLPLEVLPDVGEPAAILPVDFHPQPQYESPDAGMSPDPELSAVDHASVAGLDSAPVERAPARKQGLGTFLGGLIRRNNGAGKLTSSPGTPRRGRHSRPSAAAAAALAADAAANAGAEADFSMGPSLSPRPPVNSTLSARQSMTGSQSLASSPYPEAAVSASQEVTGPPAEPALNQAMSNAASSIRGVWQRGAPSRAKVGGSMATTARKVLPRRVDEAGRLVPLFNFSAGTMLGIAILIPIIVVAVATAVYFQAGRGEQFQVLFQQAQQYAIQSAELTDPLQQREGWGRTLEVLDQAETYKRTEDSAALRQQVLNNLDSLNGYVRLDYRPAVRSFPADVNITRIIASLNDVYLLDSGAGRIIRLYRTATGYEIDTKFTCGPGEGGSLDAEPLIDIAAMPINNEPRATVVGMDEGGSLVYCAPNMDGYESRPLAPPDQGWGRIQSMKMYGGRLYVLDPGGNAVYYYDSDDGIYADKPHFYFGDMIPKMDDVIDLAIDQEFIYLLHADGQMTICEGGGYSISPTTCSDAPYGDPRPGMEPSPLRFAGASFLHLQATQPPDPSLFVLDSANQSIYHLSLRRLNLQREYRPPVNTDFPVPNTPPTAFAVTPNRRALVAFGNQVFFAPIP